MKILFICVLLSFFSPIINAESFSAEDLAGRLDLEVPQSAGFAMLGVTPDKVIDPQGGREFGAAILSGLDSNGHFQSGFALETRPYLWDQPDYVDEPTLKERLLSGFKLSLATTTGLDDQDKANRYGIGVNWSYQFNDPLFDKNYLICVNKAANNIPISPPENKEILEAKLRKDVISCQNEHISWTTTALAFGIAAHRAEESEMDLDESGYGIWGTGSLAINKKTEIVGHVRYVDNQLIVQDNTLTQTDSTIVAARLRYGGKSTRGILEASWNDEKASTFDDDYTLVSVGVEFKVFKGAWFRMAYGDVLGSSDKEQEFFTGQLRFGYGNEPLSSF